MGSAIISKVNPLSEGTGQHDARNTVITYSEWLVVLLGNSDTINV